MSRSIRKTIMENRTKTFRVVILILLFLIGVGVIYSVYVSRVQNIPSQASTDQNTFNQTAIPTDLLPTSQVPVVTYNQTAIPTLFSSTPQAPIVTLNWAYADQNLLRYNLTISMLYLVTNPNDFENMVCDPYIQPDNPVHPLITYREVQIPSQPGEAIEATYEYEMNAKGYESLTIDLVLTIGPCADSLNFQETNVTQPAPVDLIGNYHLKFSVPVQ